MIRLTREVRFSVDRDWAGRVDPSAVVANSWAGWPSAVGVVPYLRLRVTISGEPDEKTGYLCNIQRLDELVREHAISFVAQRLHEHGWRMSAERLLQSLWERVLISTPSGAMLERLELLATPYLRFAIEKEDSAMVCVTQQFEFSAAHRLHCDALSDAENRDVFGKCNNPNGHGHNYVVETTIEGVPDAKHGVVMPLPQFERLVYERVIQRLDHKHLNVDAEEFRDINPTVENIARVVWELLADAVTPARLVNVRVYETSKTWADYAARG